MFQSIERFDEASGGHGPRRRNARPLHYLFRVGLARFEPGGGLRRSNDKAARRPEPIDDAFRERRFGTHDGKPGIGVFRVCEWIGDRGARGDFRDPWVARRGEELDAGRLAQFPGDGVLAAAGTDNKDTQIISVSVE